MEHSRVICTYDMNKDSDDLGWEKNVISVFVTPKN